MPTSPMPTSLNTPSPSRAGTSNDQPSESNGKTVFILGAGFSAAARIPTQAKLLGKALEHSDELRVFIKNTYGLEGEHAKALSLEDVYTPIHKSIARSESIKGHDSLELRELELQLTKGISEAINIDIREFDVPESYLSKFVSILREKSTHYQASVISLNWDILLDRALFNRIEDGLATVMDYGTHCTGLGNDDNRLIPGILAKDRSQPVLPLLKLHGSLNWLNCPQCDRLYVNKGRKIGLEEHSCRHCEPDEVTLKQSIILPTFQKDLNSFHYQHIWNQAATELSEATQIVFIGYSFPLADFDFRALITKHVKTDTKIEVILHESDEDLCDETKSTGQSYINYFGTDRCKISYCGVEEYMNI